ncbi:MAG: hypothetical protein COB50_03380 [Thiotrichales bacterium]|nr:MAG: hypothetical protein COB50_03380 [Thiotrichales bacterium]
MARTYNYLKSQLRDFEEEEKREKLKLLRKRCKKETLYILEHNGIPELIDDDVFYSEPSGAEQLAWAEQRLSSLCLSIKKSKNTVSYIQEMDNYIVYADPRCVGKIDFKVFPTQHQKKRRLWYSKFCIFDNWKHDLRKKYEDRVEKAIKELADLLARKVYKSLS